MTAGKVQILKAWRLAKELSDDEVKVLADLIDLHTVAEGEVLAPEGGTDRNLYVVVDGVIEVARQGPVRESIFAIGEYAAAPHGETAEEANAPRSGGRFTLAEARDEREGARARQGGHQPFPPPPT
jgi:CRP-like cAMP-binding protein